MVKKLLLEGFSRKFVKLNNILSYKFLVVYIMDTFRIILAILGGLLVIFAFVDFGSSYFGYNLTPFFPDDIAR